MRVYDNIADTFGNTPLVRIPRLNKGLGAEINQDNLNLAAVVGVDGSGAVEDRDAVPRRKARARPHLTLAAGRQGALSQ